MEVNPDKAELGIIILRVISVQNIFENLYWIIDSLAVEAIMEMIKRFDLNCK